MRDERIERIERMEEGRGRRYSTYEGGLVTVERRENGTGKVMRNEGICRRDEE